MSTVRRHIADLIHAGVVVFVVTCASVYATGTHNHSDNIWIVYGSAIAFAAGRAGAGAVSSIRSSDGGARR